MHVTLIISSLSCGGAERVMSIMANYWAVKGWAITLLTFDDGSKPPFYELDSRIKHIPLGIAGDSPILLNGKKNILIKNKIWQSLKLSGLLNTIKSVKILRSAINKVNPNAIISFIDTTNIITIMAARGLNIPVVVSERSNPKMHFIGKAWNLLRRITYPYADKIVVQTEQVCSFFSPKLLAKIAVIPNPVLPIEVHNKTKNAFKNKPVIVSMGRLGQEKGYDLLLHAFSRLKDRYPEWTLTILGDGPLRMELEHLRDQLGLNSRVHLPGIVKNPYETLKHADLFVLSSRYEGFPNALCEAMACGLPVIATDCPSGIREIIQDNINGIIVPLEDVDALTNAMEELMHDELKRLFLGSRAKEITRQFDIEKVMNMWEEVLTDVCNI